MYDGLLLAAVADKETDILRLRSACCLHRASSSSTCPYALCNGLANGAKGCTPVGQLRHISRMEFEEEHMEAVTALGTKGKSGWGLCICYTNADVFVKEANTALERCLGRGDSD